MYNILKKMPFLPKLIVQLFYALKAFLLIKLQNNHVDKNSQSVLQFCATRLLLLQQDLKEIWPIITFCSDDEYVMMIIMKGFKELSNNDFNYI